MIIEYNHRWPVDLHVAGCVCLCGDEVLLVKRHQSKPFGGMWALPTGKLEPGERTIDAVRRELAEEVGLALAESEFAPLNDVVVALDGALLRYVSFAVRVHDKPDLFLNDTELSTARWQDIRQVRAKRTIPYLWDTLSDAL